jgi:small subunit ribosomal protein S7
MPRKSFKKIEILPDPVYNNVKVAKFINHVMRRGKKSIAQKVVYDCFEIIKEKTKKDPLEIFDQAIENVAPQVEIRSKRVGGATYQIPIPVKEERSIGLAMRWIIGAARSQKGKPTKEKLAQELIDAANNTGAAIKKKNDIYKMAQANRAFAHLA